MLAVWVVCHLLSAAPAEPVGPLLGYTSSGLRLPPQAVEATAPHLYDYTFGSAPTDWEPAGGTWAVASRYTCEPEWSFFGGHGRGVCAIWNKREFAGDLAVEAYVAFKHGLDWAPETWHYIPTDLNLNLLSRPGDLASGYSFIFAGRNGSTTMIRRGAQVLAQTTDPRYLTPQFLDLNPLYQVDEEGRAFGQFHRHWWRLEARRIGTTLRLLVDGRVALEATDPDPVASGRVALWTLGSGFVIARLRLAYGQELPPPGGGVRAEEPPLPTPAADVAAR